MKFWRWRERRQREAELERELRDHLDLEAEEHQAAGVSPEEAAYAARRALGNTALIKEDVRMAWGFQWLETLLQDLRYGLRQLRRNPGFTVVAVLTLALGIGANTAIFTLINAVMLRPLPVREPSQLVLLRWTARQTPKVSDASSFGDCHEGFGRNSGCTFPYPFFESLNSQKDLFSGVTAFAGPTRLVLSGNGAARMTRGEAVSGNYFSTLGIKAAIGRLLGPEDDSPAASPAAVLSYAFWQSDFGGDRNVLGRTVRLNTTPFTIVGVAEPGFTSLTPGKAQELFLSLSMLPRLNIGWAHDFESPGNWWLVIVARLKDGTTPASAQAAGSLILRNQTLHGGEPLWKASDDPGLVLVPAQKGLNGVRSGLSMPLYVLMFTVGFILLIACANVAGLLLSRAVARQKEMAVRVALGAGRRRILRQLLTESVLLSLAGGGLGTLFAVWGVKGVVPLFLNNPGESPLSFAIAPDWRVLAFTIGISVLTGILFGLAPAFRSTRMDLTPALKETTSTFPGGTIHGGRRFRSGESLVVVQVALSMVVLIGAGLLVQTLRNLHSVDPGFDTRNILMFGINPELEKYQDSQTQNLYRDLSDRLASLPGVMSVSYSSNGLLTGDLSSSSVHIEGQPPGAKVEVAMLDTGPDFFKTVGIPLLAGRQFTSSDFQLAADAAAESRARESAHPRTTSPGPRVPVLVNRIFARRLFAGQNPLGKRLDHADRGEGSAAEVAKTRGWEIVGVVGDAKYDSLRDEIQPTMYFPMAGGGAEFELRTAANPHALIPEVRDAANRLDSNLPLVGIQTQSEIIEDGNTQERVIAQVSSFFGILALVLACVGLYGLLSYEVSRRTREIGIRMALGAKRHDATRLIISQGIVLTLAGVVIGVAGALALTRFLTTLLYGIKPTDPLTFAAVSLILIAVALAACYIPARRAAKVDPMVALRYE